MDDCGNEAETDYRNYAYEDENEPTCKTPTEAEVEVIFSTKINSKRSEGATTNTNRRPKTIFSMDVPLDTTHITSGPGENGDWISVGPDLPRKMSSSMVIHPTAASVPSAKKLLKAELPQQTHQKLVKNKSRQASVEVQEEPVLEVGEHPDPEQKCPRLLTVQGCITIMPKSEASCGSSTCFEGVKKVDEVGSSCGFNLILKRNSNKNGKRYKDIISIQNKDSDPYGFKVFMNGSAVTHFDVIPTRGLIYPGEVTSIGICTKKGIRFDMKQVTAFDKLEINVFRWFGCELDKFETFYKALKIQRPDLISKQRVQRIILWDFGNVSSSLDALDTIEDENEKRSLKADIYTSTTLMEDLSEERLALSPSKSTASLMSSMKAQLIVSEENLRVITREIISIKEAHRAILLFFCGIVFVFFIFPLFCQSNKNVELDRAALRPQKVLAIEEINEPPEHFWRYWNDLVDFVYSMFPKGKN